MAVQFCGPKFMTFWDDVGDPFWIETHLPDCVRHVSFGRYKPLKLPLSCQVVEKGGFGALDLSEEGLPQISDIHFQIAFTSEHVAGFGWVPFSELGGYSWKKKIEEEESR